MCDLRRGQTVGVAADVWALGVTLYKLLYLRDLFGTPGEERRAPHPLHAASENKGRDAPRLWLCSLRTATRRRV